MEEFGNQLSVKASQSCIIYRAIECSRWKVYHGWLGKQVNALAEKHGLVEKLDSGTERDSPPSRRLVCGGKATSGQPLLRNDKLPAEPKGNIEAQRGATMFVIEKGATFQTDLTGALFLGNPQLLPSFC